jgi:hypothetical protein
VKLTPAEYRATAAWERENVRTIPCAGGAMLFCFYLSPDDWGVYWTWPQQETPQ